MRRHETTWLGIRRLTQRFHCLLRQTITQLLEIADVDGCRLDSRLLCYQQVEQEAEHSRGAAGRASLFAVAAGHEDALRHQRLLALRQVLGDDREGIQTRIAKGGNLP